MAAVVEEDDRWIAQSGRAGGVFKTGCRGRERTRGGHDVEEATSTVAVMALGCDPVSWTPTNAPPRTLTERSPAEIEVFMTSPPQRRYSEVGLLERSKGLLESTDSAMEDLRAAAAKHGCDAIMVQGSESKTFGGMSQGSGVVTTATNMRAVCLVYTE
jgi:hypothetical protein